MVFTVPRPTAPRRACAWSSDGAQRMPSSTVEPLTIGRATDNDLVLPDSRVSRHHARLSARRGTLVYTRSRQHERLRVNGVGVAELVLGAGDRIELGDTVIVVEVGRGAST